MTVSILDRESRSRLLWNIAQYSKKVRDSSRKFPDYEELRNYASETKLALLADLPAHLERLEKALLSRGVSVLWAESRRDVEFYLREIVRKHSVKTVVKSKSMISRECGVNETLERMGCKVYETDLGAFIVQLRKELPYHIVTPAMHLSRQDVAELFHERLGTDPEASPHELTRAARYYLRDKFRRADMGIISANFWTAKESVLVFVENEGNIRLCATLPPVLVILVGIEKVIPDLASLQAFLKLLAFKGTGQKLTTYTRIWINPWKYAERQQQVYVILVDNGRSTLYNSRFSDALKCIRCGACLYVCPVYQHVGGHGYPHIYSGPIGVVIGNFVNGAVGKKDELLWLCSLCGACTDTCPVKIPLHHLIKKQRWLHGSSIRRFGIFIVTLLWRLMNRLNVRKVSGLVNLIWSPRDLTKLTYIGKKANVDD